MSTPILDPSSGAGSGAAQQAPRGPAARLARPLLLAALAVLFLGASAALAVWWYREKHPADAVPPEIPLADADPAVRQRVESALRKVREEPQSGPAWGLLGKVLRAHRFDAQANECFRQADRLDRSNPRWPYYVGRDLASVDVEAALPFLRRAADLTDGLEAGPTAPRLLLAETLFQAGRREEAEEQFRRVVQRVPGDPRALFGLGMTALAREDLQTAQDSFTKAAASPHARQRANRQLAAVCQRLGDGAAVARCLAECGKPPPDLSWSDPFVEEFASLGITPKVYLNQLNRLVQEGRFEELLPLVEQYARAYPDGQAHTGLGQVLLVRGDLEQAERAAEKALAIAPDHVQAHLVLAIVHYKQAEQQAGKGDRERDRARYQKAADSAAKVLALQSNLATAHSYRGLALLRLGREPEALEALRTAVRCRPDSAETHLFLGEALLELKQWAQAEESLRRAAERAEPDDERPRQALDRLRARRGTQPGSRSE